MLLYTYLSVLVSDGSIAAVCELGIGPLEVAPSSGLVALLGGPACYRFKYPSNASLGGLGYLGNLVGDIDSLVPVLGMRIWWRRGPTFAQHFAQHLPNICP